MGSQTHLVLWGTDADADWAMAEVARLEQRWSRFLPGSDVTRVNRAAGGPVAVAPETATLVATACTWWERTDGWFDPTVLDALVAHGYDVPFREVRARPVTRPVVESAPTGRRPIRIPAVGRPLPGRPTPGCAGVTVDPAAGTIRLPPGVHLDLGGIGKGATADLVIGGLHERGVASACLSMGGDIRVTGAAGWPVPVEDPLDEDRTWFTHLVTDGAIVTTTDRFRRWEHGGRTQHHLIDPTTGRPAETGLAAVVVAHAECATAEVLAKAAFVAGRAVGAALVARHGGEAWFRDATGAPLP